MASLGAGAAGYPNDSDLAPDRGDLIGRYVVLEEIGRGAVGQVVAAYDPELDRKVALKLMQVRGTQQVSSVRLLREAQAMARLSHPSVITVHDVGTVDDDVFIAMEFVEGGSLREWLRAQPRSWQEIVRMFISAGEGLDAAHRQGIVHRDFKPDNVLVRDDRRACVGDFGLARCDEGAPTTVEIEDLRSTLDTLSVSSASARSRLGMPGMTRTGATMGTPAYMAPEQHLRVTVDHRSDQFAFCVALWEALVGARPFAGTTLGTIALSVTSGQREPFPRDSKVSARVRAALERGLSIDPAQRFPSMAKLLEELRASLRRSGRWSRGSLIMLGMLALLTVATLGGAAMIAAGVISLSDSNAPASASGPALCSRADLQMRGVWDDELRGQAEQAFARAEQPYVRDSFARIAASLDATRDAWVNAHTRACEATRVYGEQSEELLDRRMICLAQRRNEIEAVGAALVSGDPEASEGADKLLATIAPISDCDDSTLLEAGLAAPPKQAREQVERLRASLAELTVMRRTGDPAEAKRLAAALVTQAEDAGYDPVLAEALYAQASLLEAIVGPSEALEVARRAAVTATRSGHRFELVRALTLIAWVEGTGRANFEVGLWLLDQAQAELAALGDPVILVLQVKSDRAAILTMQGEYEAGLRAFEQALEFAEAKLGPEHVRAADLRFNIAASMHYLGHYEQAEQAFRASINVYTALVGAAHPEVAQCHNNLAATLLARGQADEAERHVDRAIEIWETNGVNSQLGGAYGNLAEVSRVRGDHAEALVMFERAYAIKLEVFGPDHPITISAGGAVANAQLQLGRYDEAESRFVDGIARLSEIAGPEHPQVLELRLGLAELAHLRGHEANALAQLDTLQQFAATTGADGRHYLLAATIMQAEIERERGRTQQALAALARAEELFEAGADEQLRTAATNLRAQLEAAQPRR
ncbi:High-affnity carbon uptake protein Hat/HatR [Enhygromyxa salina]|uniref:High-affnity carbon uptake protein Hat/HatR n=1 Tax=Enhygromyxa salina TaxID=215803 RepID=A0A0C2D6S3_9BACT|nr:High-affnity carbon uptake protein Hat/HatR [Enhygromyxa salina]